MGLFLLVQVCKNKGSRGPPHFSLLPGEQDGIQERSIHDAPISDLHPCPQTKKTHPTPSPQKLHPRQYNLKSTFEVSTVFRDFKSVKPPLVVPV